MAFGNVATTLISSSSLFLPISYTVLMREQECFWLGLWWMEDVDTHHLDGDRCSTFVLVRENALCTYALKLFWTQNALQTDARRRKREWVINRDRRQTYFFLIPPSIFLSFGPSLLLFLHFFHLISFLSSFGSASSSFPNWTLRNQWQIGEWGSVKSDNCLCFLITLYKTIFCSWMESSQPEQIQ